MGCKLRNSFLSKIKIDLMNQVRIEVKDFAGFYTIPIQYKGAPYNLPFIYYTSGQCSFDRTGTCIMCNFGRGEIYDNDEIIRKISVLIQNFKGWPAIYLTPAGSMFDDVEVPSHLRLQLFSLLKTYGFESIKTETRSEFLSESKLSSIKTILGDSVDFEIGLGLESSNEWILKNCINKNQSLKNIKKAIDLCHRFGITVYSHILVGPPFLSELETINDAIESIKWAVQNGSDIVGLALTNTKPNTVTYWMESKGIYTPPTYWSLIQIIKRLPESFRDRVGLFGFDSAVPITTPMSNCPICSPVILSMLRSWCYSRDFRLILEAEHYPCKCKANWELRLSEDHPPLVERVSKTYESLARGIYGNEWWNKNKQSVLDELTVNRKD